MGNKKRSPFYDNSLLLLGITFCLWGITFIDQNTPNWNLTLNYGIKPKALTGILGIFTAPLIHINYSHLIGNTIPFMALAGIVLMNGKKKFIFTSIFCALFAGIGIWIFGADGSIHTGSSTLIFSYLGFILVQAWLVRSFLTGLLALLSVSLYGTLLLTLLIDQDGISWHGHIFGLLGGLIAAILITPSPAKKKRKAIIKID